ncbi:FecR family protein [Robertkochia solimangrovi]|uniref:FecR family protein n=1 Tax=Robertkochia solimangrovi TaxID=2213046 RepID=UPI00117DEDBB|nr:FecR family protein [Robertkochia solimangrovi]TRZ42242.1 hypothetical protein DMZ48_14535 [Robertkochia solimangrovi]
MNNSDQYYDISELLAKELSGHLTEEEKEFLERWKTASEENHSIYSHIHSDNWFQKHVAVASEFDSQRAWLKVSGKINKPVKVVALSQKLIRYAAVAAVLVLVSSAYFLFMKETKPLPVNEPPVIVNNQIIPGTDKATLTLSNGENLQLDAAATLVLNNATAQNDVIVYSDKEHSAVNEYNTLTIPRGGQYQIVLSDSTVVWLNSESKLTYPVSFKAGETREVELVYGEAYFDVSPSSKNEGSHFKVQNRSQEIEVVGTEFNVKAYHDESNVFTTLVEGKVIVSTAKGREILAPEYQSVVNHSDPRISVSKVDVYNEISWKKGIFSFNDKSLRDIMKVLSRWYDMEVVFENSSVEDKEFIGVIGKNQSIEDILSKIKNFGVINNYEINERKVIIK